MFEFMAGAMILYMLVVVLLAVAWLVIWIWALVDAVQNPALDPTMRLVWVLVILFAQVIGAIIYLVVARSTLRRRAV